MNTELNEETKTSAEENGTESTYAYKKVIRNKEQRRTFSVISIALAVLSILLAYFSWVGLVLGLLAIGAGIISRKNLGYFDKLTLAAIIVAIFGVVFSITGIAFGAFIDSLIG